TTRRLQMLNFFEFHELVFSPGFLISFGLAASPFLLLLYSLWGTWRENGAKLDAERRARRRSRQG
ncbi:MAG: hypothetical protein AAF125_17870, partial [Chloroflexota bacterium]